MSIFNEREKNEAIAGAIKEKLANGGLPNLAFKLYFKSNDDFDIVFENATSDDEKRASQILGVQAKIINKPSVSRIDPSLDISRTPKN